MDLIPSFSVDHTKIKPGIYVSRVDEVASGVYVTTYDIRMKQPNVEPAILPDAMHTIEHVIATFLRNEPTYKDKLIYWGPMGCNTGFYMILKGKKKSSEVYPMVFAAFKHLSRYVGEVPGATAVNCGNYHMHNLEIAKWEAEKYLHHLVHDDLKYMFEYPKSERLVTENGQNFFDS